MRKFNTPVMFVQELGTEEIITTSGCSVEAQACTNCYCISVDCDSSYVCTAQECAILDSL